MFNKVNCEVELDNFTGPLDLLLNLVREKEIDIFEIDLLKITDQYLAFINDYQNLDLEQVGDYLVMACYLLEIKSKYLLPKPEVEIEGEYEVDPQEELIARLIEYRKIKQASVYFKQQHEIAKQFLSKPPTKIETPKIDESTLPLSASITIDKLANSFLKMIERINLMKPVQSQIVTSTISPEQVAQQIITLMSNDKGKKWSLEQILIGEVSLQLIVATFLAILDLSLHQKILIDQEQLTQQIYLKYNH